MENRLGIITFLSLAVGAGRNLLKPKFSFFASTNANRTASIGRYGPARCLFVGKTKT
jgi:hypothetical protein